jgi:hypothetical protein
MQSFVTAGYSANGKTFATERALKQIPNAIVVLHDQDASAGQRHDTGWEMLAGNPAAPRYVQVWAERAGT